MGLTGPWLSATRCETRDAVTTIGYHGPRSASRLVPGNYETRRSFIGSAQLNADVRRQRQLAFYLDRLDNSRRNGAGCMRAVLARELQRERSVAAEADFAERIHLGQFSGQPLHVLALTLDGNVTGGAVRTRHDRGDKAANS